MAQDLASANTTVSLLVCPGPYELLNILNGAFLVRCEDSSGCF